VLRAQGKWDEAVTTLTRSTALDPRGRTAAYRLAETHLWMRNYPEALRHFDRSISLEPEIVDAYLGKAALLLARDGEMEAAEGVLRDAVALTDLEAVVSHLVAAPDGGLWFGLLSEDFGAELERLQADTTVERGSYFLARAGLHLGRGEVELAQGYCDSLRVVMERRVLEDPSYAPFQGMLGIALAGLGRAEEAVAAGERALEMTPLEADAIEGSRNRMRLAVIHTILGDQEAALDHLEALMAVPAPCCRALLRIHPLFEPLRESPRFQALTRASG
jgi:tetratricopeptide (TPR) repeat protein